MCYFRTSALVYVAALCATATGCGNSGGPKMYSVKGEVKFDGQPVPEGQITFRNLGGDHRSYTAPIAGGSYTANVEGGEMAVEIIASRIIPGKFDTSNPGEKTPVGEMYIPKEYNSATTLKASITGPATLPPFELKSGKK